MKFSKIVVLLDGSKLAEIVLPYVEEIARGCSLSELILVTVTEPIRVKPIQADASDELPPGAESSVNYHEQIFRSGGLAIPKTLMPKYEFDLPVNAGKMTKTGRNYLTKIANDLKRKGIPVSVAVLAGDLVKEFVLFAEEEQADLIIVASRDRRNFRRWDVSNAALKIFHATNIPVLLVKPPSGFIETKRVRKGKSE